MILLETYTDQTPGAFPGLEAVVELCPRCGRPASNAAPPRAASASTPRPPSSSPTASSPCPSNPVRWSLFPSTSIGRTRSKAFRGRLPSIRRRPHDATSPGWFSRSSRARPSPAPRRDSFARGPGRSAFRPFALRRLLPEREKRRCARRPRSPHDLHGRVGRAAAADQRRPEDAADLRDRRERASSRERRRSSTRPSSAIRSRASRAFRRGRTPSRRSSTDTRRFTAPTATS